MPKEPGITGRPSESIPFDRIAAKYEETRGGLDRGRRFAATIGEAITQTTHASLAETRLLEICVGTGAIARPLADLGYSVTGIDLSRPMLDLAAERLPGALLEGDAAVLPYATGTINVVPAVWAVHVVGDLDALLAEVARVLRPDGDFLVVSPTPRVDSNDLTDIAYRFGNLLGRGWDRSESFAPIAARFGFEHLGDQPTDDYAFDESPNDRADAIEARNWSSLWDLDDQTWAEVIQPVIDDLRALPNPDSPRACRHEHLLSHYRVG